MPQSNNGAPIEGKEDFRALPRQRPGLGVRQELATRIRELLAQREGLAQRLFVIDRELADLRLTAAEAWTREPEPRGRLFDEEMIVIRGEDLEPAPGQVRTLPRDLDSEDLETCVAKVVMGFRRRGESIGSFDFSVRYDAVLGKVESIRAQAKAGRVPSREVYRRFSQAKKLSEGSS
jgi:hypothetical protein